MFNLTKVLIFYFYNYFEWKKNIRKLLLNNLKKGDDFIVKIIGSFIIYHLGGGQEFGKIINKNVLLWLSNSSKNVIPSLPLTYVGKTSYYKQGMLMVLGLMGYWPKK